MPRTGGAVVIDADRVPLVERDGESRAGCRCYRQGVRGTACGPHPGPFRLFLAHTGHRAGGHRLVKAPFGSKPLGLVATPEYGALASEEVASRREFPDAPPPEEPGANRMKFWSQGETG